MWLNKSNGGKQFISQFGRIVTDETRKKIGLANTGKLNKKKGTTLSDETRKKMSIASTGRKHSDETKRKISEFNKGKHQGDKNPFYGKKSYTRINCKNVRISQRTHSME